MQQSSIERILIHELYQRKWHMSIVVIIIIVRLWPKTIWTHDTVYALTGNIFRGRAACRINAIFLYISEGKFFIFPHELFIHLL